MIGNNVEYIQACTELKCLLKYFPANYIKKLPKSLLEMIQKNSDDKYNIEIDINKSLQSQNICKKAKDILVVLTYNYWSDENQKSHLKKCFVENEEIFQKELSEKYNSENLFKNKTIETEKIETSELMVEYKDTIFTKIKNWFKGLFNK